MKYSVTEEDYNTQIQAAIDSLEAEKQEVLDGSEDYGYKMEDIIATVTTYVNNDLKVMGREISSESEGEKVTFGYIMVDNSKNYAIKEWATVNEEEMLNVVGSFKKDGDLMTGKLVATSNMEGDSFTVTVDCDKFGFVNKDNNLVSGKATISSEIEGTAFEFVIDCKVENKKQTIVTTTNVNAEMMFEMEISYEKTEATDITLPGADAKIYNALDETEIQSYLADMDINGFTKKVSDALGEDLMNMLMSSGGDSTMYSDYDLDEGMLTDDTETDEAA